MRVTCIQLEITGRTKPEAVQHALDQVDEATGSDLILLPEAWPCGYFSFDRYRSDSETVDGPTVQALADRAAALRCPVLMGSIIERDGDDLFNTAVLLGKDGRTVARYRKIHLFGHGSGESRLLKGGNEVVVADLAWGRVGLSTCYDLRFPELYRHMVDDGAVMFLIVSAWPMARLDAWRLFNVARAHENLCFLASCNCAGVDHGTQYAGHSMVIDPLGGVIAEAGANECVVTADVDLALVPETRRQFPALEDRVLLD